MIGYLDVQLRSEAPQSLQILVYDFSK